MAMAPFPCRSVLVSCVVLSTSGCGTGKTSGSPTCGETLCPGGTRPIDVTDADGGCHSTCEPLQECPTFAFPVMTTSCFSCATITSRGRSFTVSQPLGQAVRYSTCSETPDPDGELTILRYFLDVDLAQPAGLSGRARLVWSDAEDAPLCTAEFRVEAWTDGELPDADPGVDTRLALLHLLDGGLTEPGCVTLDIELMAQQVERLDHAFFWLGHSASWTNWDGTTHDDVVFRFDQTGAYDDGDWYPWQQGSVSGTTLSVQALFGTAMRGPLPEGLPAEGFERWTWYEGEEACDETFFVVGAEAVPGPGDALYSLVFARGAGSTGCTPGIWRTARGLDGATLFTLSGGEVEDLATCDLSDATTANGVPRVRADWALSTSATRAEGTLFMELR